MTNDELKRRLTELSNEYEITEYQLANYLIQFGLIGLETLDKSDRDILINNWKL